MSCVCKKFHKLSEDNQIWKRFCQTPTLNAEENTDNNSKTIYKVQYMKAQKRFMGPISFEGSVVDLKKWIHSFDEANVRTLKFVLVGDSNTGKSSFVNQISGEKMEDYVYIIITSFFFSRLQNILSLYFFFKKENFEKNINE